MHTPEVARTSNTEFGQAFTMVKSVVPHPASAIRKVSSDLRSEAYFLAAATGSDSKITVLIPALLAAISILSRAF